MAGQTDPPRMGDALPVAENDIHGCFYIAKTIDENRYFSEREQTGDVGKRNFARRSSNLDDTELRKTENHHRRDEHSRTFADRDISSGDMIDRLERQPVQPDSTSEMLLQRHGVVVAQVPSMLVADDHIVGLLRGRQVQVVVCENLMVQFYSWLREL